MLKSLGINISLQKALLCPAILKAEDKLRDALVVGITIK